ncbi:SAM-dependent methyltransferase [Trebonia sp.]|uniref:SAM-dependent methyltransferase n=1 Tax=Trebonia sp. TaxID=2767075 RepID=UPI00263087B2|nr:SAM-dependent methyltransferase [Trebonia sp.]
MAEDEKAPPDVDIRTPNMARMYDYALGGKDNFASDREAVQNLFRLAPENAYVPRANRQFLGKAVRFAAEQGIGQFVDLGAGLPSQGSTHEVARLVRPDARVVYVDSDPVVLAHARALLPGSDPGLAIIGEDIRDTGGILEHPQTQRLIDFSQPAAVLFVAVLHGIPDADDPAGIVGEFVRRLVPGSYVILSHLTREGHPADIVAKKEEVFAKSATPMKYRSRDEILRFFDGLDLVEPGLTTVTRWREQSPDAQLDAAGSWTLAGVGRKS